MNGQMYMLWGLPAISTLRYVRKVAALQWGNF